MPKLCLSTKFPITVFHAVSDMSLWAKWLEKECCFIGSISLYWIIWELRGLNMEHVNSNLLRIVGLMFYRLKGFKENNVELGMLSVYLHDAFVIYGILLLSGGCVRTEIFYYISLFAHDTNFPFWPFHTKQAKNLISK